MIESSDRLGACELRKLPDVLKINILRDTWVSLQQAIPYTLAIRRDNNSRNVFESMTAQFLLPPGRYTWDQIILFISQETQLAGGVPLDPAAIYEVHFEGDDNAISTSQHERQ